MTNQLTSNAEALRLFFTEDIYLVNDKSQTAFVEPVKIMPELEKTENITLPNAVNQVYEVESVDLTVVEDANASIKTKIDFKYLGKNQRKILILVNDGENDVSTVEGRELLRKLVNAIALTAKDFALVNYANYKTAKYEDFNDFFDCKLILAFGVSTHQLGLADQPLHELHHFGDTKLVFTTNLHDLDSDQTSKIVLWGSLQQLIK